MPMGLAHLYVLHILYISTACGGRWAIGVYSSVTANVLTLTISLPVLLVVLLLFWS